MLSKHLLRWCRARVRVQHSRLKMPQQQEEIYLLTPSLAASERARSGRRASERVHLNCRQNNAPDEGESERKWSLALALSPHAGVG
jgi:hypothetical protein